MPLTSCHTLKAVGTCPNNGLPDLYTIHVYAGLDRTLFCERIAEAVDRLLAAPTYQETFTQQLANELGCRVRTECPHLHGGRVVTAIEATPDGADAPADPAPPAAAA
jgi:hypothetical protein